ncbi:MAG TPA: DUF805 domain-containing protein [Acidisphaera sp.]|nr:DUF805 domain-containing protein [Acidisphaera sp.]
MSGTSVSSEQDGGYFSFYGRISRKTYWLNYFLPILVLDIIGSGIDYAAGTQFVAAVVSLLTLVPSLASGVKRCHDRDRSGWFLLVGLIPIVGGIWLLVELGFLRGTPGPNRFGSDPLAGTAGYQPMAA